MSQRNIDRVWLLTLGGAAIVLIIMVVIVRGC